MRLSLIFYTLVMAGVTYLLRAAPILIFQKKIENPFIQSFLFYVPYAVLAAMTFPAILTSTRCLAQRRRRIGNGINAGMARQGPVDRCAGGLRGGLCRGTDRTIIGHADSINLIKPALIYI